MRDARRPVVLIADAHEQYRCGLVRAIGAHPRLRLGDITDDGLSALALIVSQQPDLALLDVRLPHLDGFAISKQLRSYDPMSPTRVVLLCAVVDEAQRARARGVGAAGCLGKEASRQKICEALLAAVQGEQAMPPRPKKRPARSNAVALPLGCARDVGPNGPAP